MIRFLLVALGLCAGSALASSKEQCLRAANTGQDLRDSGQLRQALEAFYRCAQEGCPGVVKKECLHWATDVEGRLPSLVVSAVDEHGNDLLQTEVRVDGESLRPGSSGRAWSVNPGPHHLELRSPGRATVLLEVLVREGEKGRQVQATLPLLEAPPVAVALPAPPPRPAPPPLRPRFRWEAATATGVAALGMASFAWLGASAKADVDRMRSTCAPGCSPGMVAVAQHKEIAADVSLGVAVAAAGTALYLWLRPEPAPRVHVTGTVGPEGGRVWLSGAF